MGSLECAVSQLVLVVEHGERFAVGGIGFACVVRNLMCDGLFEEHKANLES